MTNNMLGEKMVGNYMLDITTRVGEETQSNLPCMAYAIDGEELIFAAFFGAQTANQAVKALSYEKGFLQFSRARVKAYLPAQERFKWHYQAIDSINKGCSYVISDGCEMVLEGSKRTYVMDKIGDRHAIFMHEDTITLIGQRIKEVSNAPLLPSWYKEVVKAAREFPELRNPLVYPVQYQSNCRVWGISKDGDKWAELICKLLKENKIVITLPNDNQETE